MPGIGKKKQAPVRIQLRKDDQVKVISGRDVRKTGRVLEIHSETGRVIVEGVNLVKRHTRKNPAKQIAGGIAEKEAPIAVSNVMILCGKCGAVRIKKHVDQLPGGGVRRTRVCHKCGMSLDRK
ncbi:MAG TPA: 50S ribosomal protein L24 [Bryobacteraceae bacterium]|jgi:large subunit ribosomal protein L24|nr:50S ribosomal protein L24 [Bryobacteraceae bacterium]